MKKLGNDFFIFAGIAVFLLAACALTAQDIVFTETEDNLGITSTVGQFGTGWADFDNDGDLDLLIVAQGGQHVLYRNDNGSFTDVAEELKLKESTVTQYGNQPIWFDYDHDGDLDLLFAKGLYLYCQTDTGFVDFTAAAGLDQIGDKEAYWSVAVGDYDGDGDMDIAAAGGTQGTSQLMGSFVLLDNDGGAYTDVASDAFLLETWGMAWVDIDNDRDLDLWAPTIRTPGQWNMLMINTGGYLEDGTFEALLADSMNDAIVSGWADYDNNGFLDLFAIPFNSTPGESYNKSQFWKNNGNGTLTDIAADLGLSTAFFSRCFAWGDYDNDGDLDLLIGMRDGTQLLYRNDAGLFTDVAAEAGVDYTAGGYRGVHFVDYDNDGFLDIYLAKGDTPFDKKLLHNERNSNHWIVIKPKGIADNTAGIGARVRVVAGSLVMIRDIEGSGPGLTSGKLWAHFGLGSAAVADSVIIQWPTGATDIAVNVPADEYYTFEQGGSPATGVPGRPSGSIVPDGYALFQNFPNPFNPSTTVRFRLPEKGRIRLVLINTLGKVVREIAAGDYAAGDHDVSMDALNLATGVYFYRIEAEKFSAMRKCLIVR
ncbi:VCBS repeat-containing protein [bacterium]|nr:VCBS repeat-containing protein [bacterium]